VRLVLDEHFSPTIAIKLRERGYDAVAILETRELRAMSDQDLLHWALSERRVVVTENVRDFMVLHHAFLNRGEQHAGILFTSPRAYSRRAAAVGHLIAALAAFIQSRPEAETLGGDIAWL
jgi:predicted nuclease of predicted toxin-antitoxin system